MHILKTTQTYYPYLRMGGPPVKIRGLANGLARAGHEITVLTACHKDADADVPLNAPAGITRSGTWTTLDAGIETLYLPTLANYRATTINPRAINFCLNRLHEFDVVHIYGLYDLIGSVVAWFCRRRGIPYVLEPLGMFGPKIRSQNKKRLYRRLLGNALFRGASRVIATSATEQKELIEGGIPADKVLFRRNGLDLSQFERLPRTGRFRRSIGLDEGTPLILFLGRLSFIKGLDLLVQAFAEVSDKATLVLAGPDDDDGCMKRVWQLVTELNVHDRVLQSRALYGEKKLEAFVDADVIVLPSRYESFGNAAAEAIACGTPVLITQNCGIAEIVADRAGVVVPCSVPGLAEGLNCMLGDRELLLRLQNGCATVAQGLSWDEPVRVMENVYSQMVGGESQLRVADCAFE